MESILKISQTNKMSIYENMTWIGVLQWDKEVLTTPVTLYYNLHDHNIDHDYATISKDRKSALNYDASRC